MLRRPLTLAAVLVAAALLVRSTADEPADQLTYRLDDFKARQDLAARKAAGTIDVRTPSSLYGE